LILEPEIVIMSNLVAAYEKMENKKFEDILKNKSIQEDPFIRDYVPELLVMIQTKVLLRLLQAYSSLRIQYIASELNITETKVEDLAVTLILDEKIRGILLFIFLLLLLLLLFFFFFKKK